MRLSVVPANAEFATLVVERTQKDRRFSTESHMLHSIKQSLKGFGFDVIKKRMWKDGHLFGGDDNQYIRTARRVKGERSFYVWDQSYEGRLLNEDFNKKGVVRLSVRFGIA